MDHASTIPDQVVETFTNLGIPVASEMVSTILIRDGPFVGRKFHYQSAHAIRFARSSIIKFYDETGKLLKTMTCSTGREAAA